MAAAISFQFFYGFCRTLSDDGFVFTPSQSMSYLCALRLIDLKDLNQIYWCSRSLLMTGNEQLIEFDSAFDRYFRMFGQRAFALGDNDKDSDTPEDATATKDIVTQPQSKDSHELTEEKSLNAKASLVERLKITSFAKVTDQEKSLIREISKLANKGVPQNKSRRFKASKKRGRIHLRKSIQNILKTDGELIRIHRKEKRKRNKRVVVLMDISGSMTLNTRHNLLFAYALTKSLANVECFCIGTRLRRVSKQLLNNDVDGALEATSKDVLDWDGGTRLGEGFHAYLKDSRYFSLLKGAIVFIVSDGLERGSPDQLVSSVRRFTLNSAELHWLSPLGGTKDYQPETRAMSLLVPVVGKINPSGNLEQFKTTIQGIW